MASHAGVAAARAAAEEMQVAYLDFSAFSQQFYDALRPSRAPAAFARQEPGRVDPTHHNNDGAWLLARLVAQGLCAAGLPVSAQRLDDLPLLEPTRPPLPDAVDRVPSSNFAHERPLGDTTTP